MGVKGACLPGLPPPLGERGGHPRNFHASSKKLEGISAEPNLYPFSGRGILLPAHQQFIQGPELLHRILPLCSTAPGMAIGKF